MLFLQALTAAITNSFTGLLSRLKGQAGGVMTQPLLEVSVLLSMPTVAITPSLEDAQAAITSTAGQVLLHIVEGFQPPGSCEH